MPKIRSDEHGLFVSAGGWEARPYTDSTQYKEDDEVKTHHFGGTCLAGVGKDSSCKRGEYVETWITVGCSVGEEFKPTPELDIHTKQDNIDWYKRQNKTLFDIRGERGRKRRGT